MSKTRAGAIFEEIDTIETATRVDEGGTYCTIAPREDTKEEKISVKGRLILCFEFWERTLKASNFVLKIISQGYVLPLNVQPPPLLRAE